MRVYAHEQDSAYGLTTLPRIGDRDKTLDHWSAIGIVVNSAEQSSTPYPKDWEQVADLRVFHTTPQEWEKLIGWRADMQRRGWRLLQVFSHGGDMVAVFGRTKQELLQRQEAQT